MLQLKITNVPAILSALSKMIQALNGDPLGAVVPVVLGAFAMVAYTIHTLR